MSFRVSFCSCVFQSFLSVSSSSWDLGWGAGGGGGGGGVRFVIVALPGLFSYLF